MSDASARLTDEVVEAVARAICDRDPDAMVSLPVHAAFDRTGRRELQDRPPVPAWRLFEARARGAIAAMPLVIEGAELEARIAADTLERAARLFDERAKVHARHALWMGPQRQRYEGARVAGIEMSPMNGPAISYDREMANAEAIRALKVTS